MTTKHFRCTYVEMNQKEITKRIKVFLWNKRHSIKVLPYVTGKWGLNSCSLMEMLPFFPRIQALGIFPTSNRFKPQPKRDLLLRSVEKDVLRSYGYFWNTLGSLQVLRIRTSSPEIWLILQRIQSSERFLSSLKTLDLIIDIPRPRSREYHPGELFQALLKFPGVLKHVTQLRFCPMKGFHVYGAQVQSLIDSCPKLHSVSFPIDQEFDTPKKRHLTLAPLKSFQNVTILTLKVYDVWSFIEAFELSSSLKKLELHLYYRSDWNEIWRDLYQEPNSESSLVKQKKLLDFFERFKQLTSLKSFELNMPRFTDANDIMKSFILPLLRSAPKLEDFKCQLYREYVENNHPFDISMFLDGIAGSLKQLKSFKIFQRPNEEAEYSIEKEDLLMTFRPQKVYSLPILREVNIGTFISQDFDFKSFLTMITSSETNPPPLAKKKISFSRVYVDSVKSFHKILKIFKEADQFQTLEISLGILFRLRSLLEIPYYFSSPILPANNAFIHLKVYFPDFKKYCFSNEGFKMMQSAFGKVKYDIYCLIQKKARSSSNEERICQSAIINNSRKLNDYYDHSDDDNDNPDGTIWPSVSFHGSNMESPKSNDEENEFDSDFDKFEDDEEDEIPESNLNLTLNESHKTDDV